MRIGKETHILLICLCWFLCMTFVSKTINKMLRENKEKERKIFNLVLPDLTCFSGQFSIQSKYFMFRFDFSHFFLLIWNCFVFILKCQLRYRNSNWFNALNLCFFLKDCLNFCSVSYLENEMSLDTHSINFLKPTMQRRRFTRVNQSTISWFFHWI